MWDKPQLLTWLANLLTALALLLLFYAVVFLAVHSPLFPVRWISVVGDRSHVTLEQLEYVKKNELKGTFFTLDLDKTRQSFEKLPWVRRVEARRYWPDRLEVTIEEHKAIARWGNSALLNTYGERFDAAAGDTLPILEGPDGTEKQVMEGYRKFCDILLPIGKQPTHVWLSDRRAWRLEVDRSVIVEVGREDGMERLQRFVTAYPNSLARLDVPFEYVDLRYPNGYAVRMPGFKADGNKAVKPAEPAAKPVKHAKPA